MKFLSSFFLRFRLRQSQARLAAEKRKKSAEGLTEDQQLVQKAAWHKVDAEMDMLVTQYEAANGNILDADRAKDLFPEYAANVQTRRRYLRAVYEPAQQVVDEIFRRRLKAASNLDKVVVFTAGGPGSGKSTLIETLQASMSDALAIMDGTLSERDRALNNIELALQSGCNISIIYLHRPFADSVHGAIDRALSPLSARTVPMRIIALKHFGAMHTIISLAGKYRKNERVSVLYRRFCGHGQPFQDASLADIIAQRNKSASLDVMIHKAYLLLDERYARAQASDISFPREVYEALKSQAPSFRRPRR